MSLWQETAEAIQPVDHARADRTQLRLDLKTKPRGSLGKLESLACRLTAITGKDAPASPNKTLLILVADHGVAEEGVSAYPQEVTAQMVKNFATGGAAINVLGRQAGARVVVADLGVKHPIAALAGVLQHSLGPGTANCTQGPAMSQSAAEAALEIGIRLARETIAQGCGLIGIGEMGIANSTVASAMTSVFTGSAPHTVCGRGTGIDDTRWALKVEVIERALAVNRPRKEDALEVIAKVGGFEIAGLAGVILGAASARVPVLLDGFITGAAALAAVQLCPRVRDYLIASHLSVEPGHAILLQHLHLNPLLDLGLRLGEGTGAALAMHLVEAAWRILGEMATFKDAGVTDAGA